MEYATLIRVPMVDELLEAVAEEQGKDLLRESTRRTRRALLLTASTAFISAIFGILPKSVNSLEVDLSPAPLRTALAMTLVYSLAQWQLESQADRSKSKIRYRKIKWKAQEDISERKTLLERAIQEIKRAAPSSSESGDPDVLRDSVQSSFDSLPAFLTISQPPQNPNVADLQQAVRRLREELAEQETVAREALTRCETVQADLDRFEILRFVERYRLRLLFWFNLPVVWSIICLLLFAVAWWYPAGLVEGILSSDAVSAAP